ncbi:SRPBCC family protein [Actinokineospora guangxiensis]|uniref:SRPBCC family protein n=1 Tax=Actinokineospora guangxiensis TaxID=1490288 RepID=A0ABW0EWK2_9PSEU
MDPTITRATPVAADADLVWSLVTDLPGMARFSPENVGGVWLDGGPALGARFRGTNRNGEREWWTRVRVVEFAPPGRGSPGRFAFDARTPFGMRVSRWAYEVTPTAEGCLLAEHWYRVGNRFIRTVMGPQVTGQADRPGFNAKSIEHTLAAVKAHAEARAAA